MWPFTRRRREPQAPYLPSDAWRAGDVAECVVDSWRTSTKPQPKVGCRAIVVRVAGGPQGDALELIGYRWRWDASAFRKVVPPERTADRLAAAPVPIDA